MAHTVTGASLNDIYTKLNGVSEYHPLDAETFADWSVQAGDVITVKRGTEEYQSPVHSSRMVWRGTPQTTISSTGKKERDAISKVSRKKYGRGGTAVRSQEYIYKEFTSSDGMLHSAIYMSESKLTTQFDNAISDVHSSILQTADQIYSEVHASSSTLYSYIDQTATYMESVVADINNDLGSAILQTASQIRSEVHAANSTLYSYIDQTATYIEAVVADVNNNLGSAILQTASQIRSEVHAANSNLYSYIDQTATYISAVVENVESSLGSNIVQTAEQIYSEVHAANSTVYSYINQTATSITSRVEDVNEDLHTEILQTQSMIRSAVWTANSTVYAYVDQTASYILDHVGERSGSKVIASLDEPQDTSENPLSVGDIWIEGTEINAWDDFPEGSPWIDYDPYALQLGWQDVSGQKIHVFKEDGKFHLVEDGTKLVEDTDFIRLKDQVSTIAYNYEKIDGELRGNLARLDVRADSISSAVQQNSRSIGEVGSRITQTATQIRAEVHAANSQLYSAIEQTATSIRSYVVDEINDIGSEILQTASQIRAEVHAANSRLYSAIEQTATSIRSYVVDEINDIGSEILQTASQIRSEVHAAKSTLYSYIDQTATYIRQAVANTESSLRSSITTEANRISLVVEGTGANAKIKPASIVQSINNGASSIIISANHINLDGYVKASDITADYIKGKIASISSVSMQSLVASNIQFSVGGGLYGNPANAIMNLQLHQSGNNSYQIWGSKFNGEIVKTESFSRAVSSWVWGGGNGKINVTALPQNQTKPVSVSIDGQNTITSNGTYTYTVDYENADGDDVSTGAQKTITVNVPGGGTPNRIEIWTTGSGAHKVGNEYFAKGGMTIYPWVQIGGTSDYSGAAVTLSDPYSDKGSYWTCSITQSGSNKTCRLSKDFAVSQSIPFNSGSQYHLYT